MSRLMVDRTRHRGKRLIWFRIGLGVVLLIASLAIAQAVLPTDEDGSSRSASNEDGLARASGYMARACQVPARWIEYLYRGWAPDKHRAWDLTAVPAPDNWFGSFGQTSHSGPYDYLQRVPLVFYGPGFIKSLGRVDPDREVTLADVAATSASMMGFDEFDRSGRALFEILKPTDRVPRLIVTAVIDGGGWNVLNEWPGQTKRLRRLERVGASIGNAVVGSSPSITPAVHSTLSTGLFPRDHGVMSIVMRRRDGSIGPSTSTQGAEVGGAFADPTATLEETTLADEWDLATGNRALNGMLAAQNFHLGMVGHGAALKGADKDIAVMLSDPNSVDYSSRAWATNPKYYALPDYVNDEITGPEQDLAELDRADGKADGLWRGHGFWRLEATPAFSKLQTRVMETVILREGFGADEIPDLFYVNYKAPDAAGHAWNMIAPEQGDVVGSVDQQLDRLVGFLDDSVGDTNYVLIVTADHGQTPLGTRGWAIKQGEVANDVDEAFDRVKNGISIVQRTSSAIYFLNKEELVRNGVTPEAVASFLSEYTIAENVPDGEDVAEPFVSRSQERIFDAVIPGRGLGEARACARSRS